MKVEYRSTATETSQSEVENDATLVVQYRLTRGRKIDYGDSLWGSGLEFEIEDPRDSVWALELLPLNIVRP